MIKPIQLMLFSVMMLFSQYAISDNVTNLFSATDKQVTEQVELFQFNSPEQQAHAINLAKSLRCPQCQNQNLVESNSPIAKDLRLLVYKKVKSGESDQQIIDYLTSRFGDFVLYKPTIEPKNYLLWFLPFGLFLLLISIFARMILKQRKAIKDQ
ncbi:cytochrome c-type biogenesis protein CcmH [Vibrio sp. SS-MA-C1-2]|uniref:cytochrome c-type biogenesis protein n=1 Tax=Vibrio sp. SS-MA-C1-2 TaxID=2908646 RepID=UPI001F3BB953|nr:cytochrome c-type biogenesis protein [Vibrio sp. SS-MA-C1-2]UJF18200.1 cytochrome c-type biogenesis protein CcmH [Vibrio sp. SS-MA-C1-2]